MKKLLFSLILIIAGPLNAAGFTPLDRVAASKLLDAGSYREPTIVTLWSSDCSHCKKNLQFLSEYAKTNKRLRIITLAAEQASSDLGPLLDRYPLPGPRYAYGSDNPEAIAYAIDPNWAGELPRSYLFNGKGGKEKISGVINAAILEKGLAAK
jgi:thiol-disulfide isomerase/thioredoxin